MHLWVYTNNTHTLVLKLHAMLDMLLLLLKQVIGILSTAFVFSVLGVMQLLCTKAQVYLLWWQVHYCSWLLSPNSCGPAIWPAMLYIILVSWLLNATPLQLNHWYLNLAQRDTCTKGGSLHMPCSHNCDRVQSVVNGQNGFLAASQHLKLLLLTVKILDLHPAFHGILTSAINTALLPCLLAD